MNAENQGEKTLLYDNSGATAENLDLREVLAQISQIRAIRELFASESSSSSTTNPRGYSSPLGGAANFNKR